jgi:hypothetical protein
MTLTSRDTVKSAAPQLERRFPVHGQNLFRNGFVPGFGYTAACDERNIVHYR